MVGAGPDPRGGLTLLRGALAALVIGIAATLVILALAILPFLTPAWVAFGQAQAEATAWTGYTTDELRTVTDEVAAAHDVVAVAAVHRVGDLAVGDLAVVVAVSCAHRGEAFVACRALIDELKSRVPIWKHQVFADGGDEWVGLP